jgi:hypothetical protein
MSGVHGRPADPLPLGPAQLQWSFNRDGEASAEMIAARDQRLDFDSGAARSERADLVELARPQGGVDALAASFPKARPLPAVTDDGNAAAGRVPKLVMGEAGAPR